MLPHSASRVIPASYTTQVFVVPVLLMYPGRQSSVCCPVLVLLLTLGFRSYAYSYIHLGNVALQINNNEYFILANARKQLSVLPSARSLYLKAKTQLTQFNKSQCENHLQTLTVHVV